MSSFIQHSKNYMLGIWLDKLPDRTCVFTELSCMPSFLSEMIDYLEDFVMTVYDPSRKFSSTRLNDLRFALFKASVLNDLRWLPPTGYNTV